MTHPVLKELKTDMKLGMGGNGPGSQKQNTIVIIALRKSTA